MTPALVGFGPPPLTPLFYNSATRFKARGTCKATPVIRLNSAA